MHYLLLLKTFKLFNFIQSSIFIHKINIKQINNNTVNIDFILHLKLFY